MPRKSKAEDARSMHHLGLDDFATTVFDAGYVITKNLKDATPIKVETSFEREPDEYEFYLLRVSEKLANLLILCNQMDDIPYYIKHIRVTKTLQSSGVDPHDLLVYHLENYLIRCQGLYDRTIAILDAVFHLTNSDNLKDHTVLSNIKVARSNVGARVKKLKRLIDRYTANRNLIVHQRTLQTNEIRRLEMYDILIRQTELGLIARGARHEARLELREEQEDDIIREKQQEFIDFNREVSSVLTSLFDDLTPHYVEQRNRLATLLRKSDI